MSEKVSPKSRASRVAASAAVKASRARAEAVHPELDPDTAGMVVRMAKSGDTPPSLAPNDVARFTVSQATVTARERQLEAALRLIDDSDAATAPARAQGLRALLEGAPADDRKALRKALKTHDQAS
ncbi:MAG: hypothetical protein LBH31_01135, partial [Burkholderiaceae bacterium]|nr:hypothetical protein [Burkholderiaceae bacterium]